MKLTSLIIYLLFCNHLQAKELIPDELKENVNAVVLENSGSFEIKSDNKATFSKTIKVIILNEGANNYSKLAFDYDNLRKVLSLEASVYDIDGKQIKKVNKRNFEDYTLWNNSTLYDDNRMLVTDLRQQNFPYILEYTITWEYKYLFHIPNWNFFNFYDERVSLINSTYEIIAPKELAPNIKALHFEGQFSDLSDENNFHNKWELKNRKPNELEYLTVPIREQIPYIMVSPGAINYEGYIGNMSTWSGFGEWIYSLNKGRNTISNELISKLRKDLEGLSDLEKTKRIYEYVQTNTRYVNISLGIGGYQPIESGLVEQYGYGDCKALSFFTKSLLDAVGIKSYYTLVESGRNNHTSLDRDFAFNAFNHVILLVPIGSDSVWLECTSQTQPFNFLGSFTENRDVLIIDENGGQIRRTPSYTARYITSAEVSIHVTESSPSIIKVNQSYEGLASEYRNLDNVATLGNEKYKKWLTESLPIATYDLINYSLAVDTVKPNVSTFYSAKVYNLAIVKANRFFLQPNMLNQSKYVPEDYESRKYSISISNGYEDIDTTIYNIPIGLEMEADFNTIEIKSPFGYYRAVFQKIDNGAYFGLTVPPISAIWCHSG